MSAPPMLARGTHHGHRYPHFADATWGGCGLPWSQGRGAAKEAKEEPLEAPGAAPVSPAPAGPEHRSSRGPGLGKALRAPAFPGKGYFLFQSASRRVP